LLHTDDSFAALWAIGIVSRCNGGDGCLTPWGELRDSLGGATLAFHAAAAGSHGDGVQPRAGLCLTPKGVPLAEGLQEHILHEIFGIGLVAAEAEGEAVQLGPVLLEQRGDGFACVCGGHA
jgi:hypothetical protein